VGHWKLDIKMDNRNLILAIVLSVVILLGFEMLYPSTPPQTASDATTMQTVQPGADPSVPTPPQAQSSSQPAAPGAAPMTETPVLDATQTVEQVVAQGARVSITTPSVTGSIALKGGRIDDLILNGYNETLDEGSAKIRLLSPRGTEKAYYEGKVASARFFCKNVLPHISATRKIVEASTLDLMELDEAAF